MSQPRKRPRSVEHQEAAEQERYEAGIHHGIQMGREQMAFELGQRQGYEEGFHHGQCTGYQEGYADSKAGKPSQHRHIPDNVSELMDGDGHE
jgi:flagellar biosynthesis/type III secretory pathway protein FliH